MLMTRLMFLAFAGVLWTATAGAAEPGPARLAQLPRYSASGLHQCDSGGSCVVTGLFSDCNEAGSALRTRDCCRTSSKGGKSSSFALTYCIPDIAR